MQHHAGQSFPTATGIGGYGGNMGKEVRAPLCGAVSSLGEEEDALGVELPGLTSGY